MLSGLSFFGLGQGTGDIDHGQQGKDIGLNEAGEQIKVAGENSGDAVGQEGEVRENTGDVQDACKADHSRDDTEDQCNGLVIFLPQQHKCAPRTSRITLGSQPLAVTRLITAAEARLREV